MVKLKRIVPKFLRKKNKKKEADNAESKSNIPESSNSKSNEVLTDEAIEQSKGKNVESIEKGANSSKSSEERNTSKAVSEILGEIHLNEKTKEVKDEEEVKNNAKQDTTSKSIIKDDSKNDQIKIREAPEIVKDKTNYKNKKNEAIVSNIVSDDENVDDGNKLSKPKEDYRIKQIKQKKDLAANEDAVDYKNPIVPTGKDDTRNNDQEVSAIPDFVEADHVPPVSASKQWLVDFEKRNKEHARKGTKRSIDASSIGREENKVEPAKKLEPSMFGIFKKEKEDENEKKEIAKKLDATKFDMFKSEDRHTKKESTKKLDSSMFAMFKSLDEKPVTPMPKKLRTDKFQMFTSPEETHLKTKNENVDSAEVESEVKGEKQKETEDKEKNEADVEPNTEATKVENNNDSEVCQEEECNEKDTIDKKVENNIDNSKKVIVKSEVHIDGAKDDDRSTVEKENITHSKKDIEKGTDDTNKPILVDENTSKTNKIDSLQEIIDDNEKIKNDVEAVANIKENESQTLKPEQGHSLIIEKEETETIKIDDDKAIVDEKIQSQEVETPSEKEIDEGTEVGTHIDSNNCDCNDDVSELVKEANADKNEADDVTKETLNNA